MERINNKSWEITYPDGAIKIIDAFRKKYLQYEVYDKEIERFICTNMEKGKKMKICSLGAGTGHHEIEFLNKGYDVVALEKNEESVKILQQKAANFSNFEVYHVDCMSAEDIERAISNRKFDIFMLNMVPLSIADSIQMGKLIYPYLNDGGIYLTGFFGYEDNLNFSRLKLESNVEVVDLDDGSFATRLNYYEYKNNIVHWDAVYTYCDETGSMKMIRDNDVLEVMSESEAMNKIAFDSDKVTPLQAARIVECEEGLNPPHLYEYLIGWKKNVK